MSKFGVRTKVRRLLEKNVFYTIEELAILAGTDEGRVRQMISVLKNPKYVTDPLDLVPTIGQDRKKRWGLRTATENYR